MQLQADLLGVPVIRSAIQETTALGAAYLAGLAIGFWQGTDEIAANWQLDRRFEPAMAPGRRAELRGGWSRAVARARSWASREPSGTVSSR
jgi:glycerol kinase